MVTVIICALLHITSDNTEYYIQPTPHLSRTLSPYTHITTEYVAHNNVVLVSVCSMTTMLSSMTTMLLRVRITNILASASIY